MTRKNLLLVLSVILILVLLAIIGGYFYLSNTRATLEPESNEGIEGDVGLDGPYTELSTTTINIGTPMNPTVDGVPKLRKISATPVAGSSIFYRKVGTTTVAFIRYVDRGTGHIYETATSTLVTNKITNTTIPKVVNAKFSADGNSIVLQYTNESDEIQTFVGKTSADTTDLNGTFITSNASGLTSSPSKNRFFYFLPNQTTRGSIATISDFTPKASVIFNSPLRGWEVDWPSEDILVLTNKPTSVAQSVAYSYNTRTKSGFNKLMGPRNGLVVTPSPNLSKLIFSETRNNTLLTGLRNVVTGQENYFTDSTIPDKCVWSRNSTSFFCAMPKFVANGEYPDVWYLGLVSFNDVIMEMGGSSPENRTDPLEAVGVEIDAIDLQLSPDEKYILFTNKKDLSLWGLRLD
jgi:hypothetical protein